ncbi:MAG: AAA family ATPase, partial [Paludibacteraceae bacterium]|nr:AAA family ATPase [Paludibacteraceae bacterium]
MDIQGYRDRVCDAELQEQLEASGAILIEGAKWCGKTYAARHAAQSALFMQDRNMSKRYKQIASSQPSLLLEGATPRLIDEWEEAPVLWDAVRFEVDMRGKMGQFILTGSAVPKDDKNLPEDERRMHTGVGRIAPMRMRTMSLWESGESNGKVSLEDLFNKQPQVGAISELTIEQLAYAICRGGWPASIPLKERAALKTARNYVEEVINYDVHRVDGIEKNPLRVRKLLESYARNISTMATNETIMADVRATDQ